MDGLFFLMSILGTVLVVYWVVTNDRVGPDKPTQGMFAMREGRRKPARRRQAGPFPDTEPPPAAPGKPAAAKPLPVGRRPLPR